jgi:hypothetical protein
MKEKSQDGRLKLESSPRFPFGKLLPDGEKGQVRSVPVTADFEMSRSAWDLQNKCTEEVIHSLRY